MLLLSKACFDKALSATLRQDGGLQRAQWSVSVVSCGELYKIDYTDPISRKSSLAYAGCWLETPRGMCEKLT